MTESSSSTGKPQKDPGLPLPGREGEEVAFERTVPARTDRLTGRSRDRIRALDVVYEADARRRDVNDVLSDRIARTAAQSPLPPYARELVALYAQHVEEIDEQLSTHSRDWPLHRMPAVDRAILRLGTAEVVHGPEQADTPRGLIVGEYTKIAEVLSTDDSPRFVNGLLQRMLDMRGLLG